MGGLQEASPHFSPELKSLSVTVPGQLTIPIVCPRLSAGNCSNSPVYTTITIERHFGGTGFRRLNGGGRRAREYGDSVSMANRHIRPKESAFAIFPRSPFSRERTSCPLLSRTLRTPLSFGPSPRSYSASNAVLLTRELRASETEKLARVDRRTAIISWG